MTTVQTFEYGRLSVQTGSEGADVSTGRPTADRSSGLNLDNKPYRK